MIVRELVTKLGFQVDKSGLERFEKSVVSFKTKFALAASLVGVATAKTLNYFNEIAKESINLQELARNVKLADDQFIALRRTAEDFQIDPKQFDQSLVKLSKLLREAKTGYGELFEIQKRSRGQLNLKQFVESSDVLGAFKEILDYVKSLGDVQNRIAAVSDIFGEDKVNGILRIVDFGSEKFIQAAEKNKVFADSLLESTKNAKEFQKSLNDLYKEISFIKNEAIKFSFPIVQKLTEGAGFLLEMNREEGFLQTSKNIIDFLKNSFTDFASGLGNAENKISNLPLPSLSPTQINNRIEVNVPPGTSEENAKIIGEEVKAALEDFWDEKTREVISNNPQVE